jgi:hypothetical protein
MRRDLSQLGSGTAGASTNAFNLGLHLRAAYTVPINRMYRAALEIDAIRPHQRLYRDRSGAVQPKRECGRGVVVGATPGARIGSRFN